MSTITKPWIDTTKYREDRLREAILEAELAERFLNNGLLRNAAGKAFQAVKAYLASVAVDHRDKLAPYFPGKRRLGNGREVNRVDWIIATMPTGRMKEIATIIGDEELLLHVEIALDLHEFQYNGFDKDKDVSKYSREDFVKADIQRIIKFIKERTQAH